MSICRWNWEKKKLFLCGFGPFGLFFPVSISLKNQPHFTKWCFLKNVLSTSPLSFLSIWSRVHLHVHTGVWLLSPVRHIIWLIRPHRLITRGGGRSREAAQQVQQDLNKYREVRNIHKYPQSHRWISCNYSAIRGICQQPDSWTLIIVHEYVFFPLIVYLIAHLCCLTYFPFWQKEFSGSSFKK